MGLKKQFFPNNLSIFPKKPQILKVLRTLMLLYKLRGNLKKRYEVFRFWKISCTFRKKSYLISQKIRLYTFGEIFSKNTIWEGFYIKFAKTKDFQKNRAFFPKKTNCFPNKTPRLTLLRILKQKFLWYTFYKTFANNSNFKKA